MLTKMYLGEILLFLIVVLCGHVTSGKLIRIVLNNNGEVRSVQTPGFPRFVGPLNTITWEMYAPTDSLLQLDCTNITLTKTILVRGEVSLWDSTRWTDISRSDFTRGQSENSYMELKLRTWLSFARINCSVQLIGVKAIWDEPDSRELGFGSQERTTTSCPCGWTNKANKKRIIGGRETLPNEFVFMAYLRRYDDEHEVYYTCCTASILTQRHILTAAHCLSHRKEEYEVVVGGHDDVNGSMNGVNQTMKIHKIYPHEFFQFDILLHDIAIIELTGDIEFSQFVGPVCIPSQDYYLTGQWVKALGWGDLSIDGSMSQTLRTVNLRVFNIKHCIPFYLGLSVLETKLCIYSPKGGTYKGDSGGPYVYYDSEIDRYVQVGVISFGDKIYPSFYPSVCSKVYHYLKWIKDVIARRRYYPK